MLGRPYSALRGFIIALLLAFGAAQPAALEDAPVRGSNFLAVASSSAADGDVTEAAPAPVPASAPAPGPAAVDGMSSSSQAIFTTLASEAVAGSTVLDIVSSEGFEIGSRIVIGEPNAEGGDDEDASVPGPSETRTILGFGSIILDSALRYSYPANTVVRLAPPDAPLSSAPVPALDTTAAPSSSGGDASKGITVVSETAKQMDDLVTAEKDVMDPNDPLSELKEELAAIAWMKDELEEMKAGLKEEVYRAKIAAAEQQLAKEASPGTAKMLGDMRREMHHLAAPFFEKVLDDNLAEVSRREKELLVAIAENDLSGANASQPLSESAEEEPQEQHLEDGAATTTGEVRRGMLPKALNIQWVAVYLVFVSIAVLLVLGAWATWQAIQMWRSGTHPAPRLI